MVTLLSLCRNGATTTLTSGKAKEGKLLLFIFIGLPVPDEGLLYLFKEFF